MKKTMKRGVSLCMAVALLITATALAPPASAAGEEMSLEYAKVEVMDYCEYDGDEETPDVSVMLGETELKEGIDYELSYSDNVEAGIAKVVVKGIGKYFGSQERTFRIYPRPITFKDMEIESGYQKEFDGTTDASPKIKAKGNGIFKQDQEDVDIICVKGEFDSPFAESGKTVVVTEVRLEGPKAGNYEFKASEYNLIDEWTRITPKLPKMETSGEVAVGYSFDLKTLITNGWDGGLSFSLKGDPEEVLGCSISDNMLLTGEETGTVTVLAILSERNVDSKGDVEYSLEEITDLKNRSTQKEVTISIVEKEEQPPIEIEDDDDEPPKEEIADENQPDLLLTGKETIYYGQTVQLETYGGAGSGTVTFEWKPYNSGEVSVDTNGLLVAEKVGKVLVTAKKAGDERYKEAESEPLIITILPAPLTIQVKNQTAYVGSVAPTLTAADYTVTGLVGEDKLAKEPTLAYVTAPDMTRPGAVAIQVSGAEIPNSNYDPNITYVPGVLTIQEVPSYTITVQPVENGSIVSDLDTAKEGDTVTLTTKPAEGYLLDTLTVTSDALAPGTVSVKDMGEGIYTFSMPAGNVTVSGTMVPEEATQEWPPFPFDDVSEDDWYYDSVYYVYAYGLMNGAAEATFNPDGATTRGMLVTILYRMEGSPQGGGWSPFTDVDPELYYAQPIAWAAWNGIVKGITDTTFSPDAPVTRQQMAAILYRYAAWKKWDVSQQGNLFQFTDWEQIQEYARTPLAWASAAGLIQGKENNILDPAGTATRAQVATILQRFHSAYVVPAEEEAALL